MDESGLFFRLLPRYSLLMLDEDISTIRRKKKSKDRVSLIVCANAVGTHKSSSLAKGWHEFDLHTTRFEPITFCGHRIL
jgi:hypothetical protein